MTDDRLKATHYFDLSGLSFREIFDDVDFVWQVIPKIGSFVEAMLKETIAGTVLDGAFLDGKVQIGEGTIVEPGAYLIGPVIIGRNCVVRSGVYLRGPVLAGDGVVLGHSSEFKNCILMDYCQVPHFNYVGDSVIGVRAHLAAGVIVANLKLTRDQIVLRLDGAEYPTGLTKFGVILGDRSEIGCQSVINPGTLIGPETVAYPLSSLRGYYPPRSLIKTRVSAEIGRRS